MGTKDILRREPGPHDPSRGGSYDLETTTPQKGERGTSEIKGFKAWKTFEKGIRSLKLQVHRGGNQDPRGNGPLEKGNT